MTTATAERSGLYRAQIAIAAITVVLSAVTLVSTSSLNALGVAVGGALSALNLWAISRVVGGFLSGETKLPWALMAAVKVTVLFAAIYWLANVGIPLAWLFLGYAALPVGIVVAQSTGYKAAHRKG